MTSAATSTLDASSGGGLGLDLGSGSTTGTGATAVSGSTTGPGGSICSGSAARALVGSTAEGPVSTTRSRRCTTSTAASSRPVMAVSQRDHAGSTVRYS